MALVTDAGTPGISDPGATLVRAVRQAGRRVEPVPGASALTAALSAAGLDADLTYRQGPIAPVLARIDPLLMVPIELSPDEVDHFVAFVRDGLLDERATKQNLCRLVPRTVPSGFPTMYDAGRR